MATVGAPEQPGSASDHGPVHRRVLHITAGLRRGGVETLLINCSKLLGPAGYRFDFVVWGNDGEEGYGSDVRSQGGRVHTIPHPRRTAVMSWTRSLQSVMTNQGPYVAVHSHVHHLDGLAMFAAQRAGVPVRVAHGHLDDRRDWTKSGYPFRASMTGLINRYSTVRVACSAEAARTLFGARWARRGARVLANGIDVEQFAEARDMRAQARSEWGIPVDTLVVGHAGRFDHQKNHRFLLDVFAEFLSGSDRGYLLLAGEGILRPEIQAQATHLGIGDRVRFVGSIAHMAKFFGALDVFAFPSHFEGTPLVLLEAQAAGIPCVVSRRVPRAADVGIGALRFLALEDSVADWSDALRESAALPVPEIATRRAAFALRGLSVASMAGHLSDIYQAH